jgi:lysozyme family protein
MKTPTYLERESLYLKLWNSAELIKVPELDRAIDRITPNISRYNLVNKVTEVSPIVIALIHLMESDLNFSTHLFNGDPLTARTVNEPKGQPTIGDPPFSWQHSAVEALEYDKLDKWQNWSIAGICYILEQYNGWGYVPTPIYSPYLWSYTRHYNAGKFVKDGVFNYTVVSEQPGAIAILKRMVQRNLITLEPVWNFNLAV